MICFLCALNHERPLCVCAGKRNVSIEVFSSVPNLTITIGPLPASSSSTSTMESLVDDVHPERVSRLPVLVDRPGRSTSVPAVGNDSDAAPRRQRSMRKTDERSRLPRYVVPVVSIDSSPSSKRSTTRRRAEERRSQDFPRSSSSDSINNEVSGIRQEAERLIESLSPSNIDDLLGDDEPNDRWESTETFEQMERLHLGSLPSPSILPPELAAPIDYHQEMENLVGSGEIQKDSSPSRVAQWVDGVTPNAPSSDEERRVDGMERDDEREEEKTVYQRMAVDDLLLGLASSSTHPSNSSTHLEPTNHSRASNNRSLLLDETSIDAADLPKPNDSLTSPYPHVDNVHQSNGDALYSLGATDDLPDPPPEIVHRASDVLSQSVEKRSNDFYFASSPCLPPLQQSFSQFFPSSEPPPVPDHTVEDFYAIIERSSSRVPEQPPLASIRLPSYEESEQQSSNSLLAIVLERSGQTAHTAEQIHSPSVNVSPVPDDEPRPAGPWTAASSSATIHVAERLTSPSVEVTPTEDYEETWLTGPEPTKPLTILTDPAEVLSAPKPVLAQRIFSPNPEPVQPSDESPVPSAPPLETIYDHGLAEVHGLKNRSKKGDDGYNEGLHLDDEVIALVERRASEIYKESPLRDANVLDDLDIKKPNVDEHQKVKRIDNDTEDGPKFEKQKSEDHGKKSKSSSKKSGDSDLYGKLELEAFLAQFDSKAAPVTEEEAIDGPTNEPIDMFDLPIDRPTKVSTVTMILDDVHPLERMVDEEVEQIHATRTTPISRSPTVGSRSSFRSERVLDLAGSSTKDSNMTDNKSADDHDDQEMNIVERPDVRELDYFVESSAIVDDVITRAMESMNNVPFLQVHGPSPTRSRTESMEEDSTEHDVPQMPPRTLKIRLPADKSLDERNGDIDSESVEDDEESLVEVSTDGHIQSTPKEEKDVPEEVMMKALEALSARRMDENDPLAGSIITGAYIVSDDDQSDDALVPGKKIVFLAAKPVGFRVESSDESVRIEEIEDSDGVVVEKNGHDDDVIVEKNVDDGELIGLATELDGAERVKRDEVIINSQRLDIQDHRTPVATDTNLEAVIEELGLRTSPLIDDVFSPTPRSTREIQSGRASGPEALSDQEPEPEPEPEPESIRPEPVEHIYEESLKTLHAPVPAMVLREPSEDSDGLLNLEEADDDVESSNLPALETMKSMTMSDILRLVDGGTSISYGLGVIHEESDTEKSDRRTIDQKVAEDLTTAVDDLKEQWKQATERLEEEVEKGDQGGIASLEAPPTFEAPHYFDDPHMLDVSRDLDAPPTFNAPPIPGDKEWQTMEATLSDEEEEVNVEGTVDVGHQSRSDDVAIAKDVEDRYYDLPLVPDVDNDDVTNTSEDAVAVPSINDDVIRAVEARSNRYYDLRDFALTPDVVEVVYSPTPVTSPIGEERKEQSDTGRKSLSREDSAVYEVEKRSNHVYGIYEETVTITKKDIERDSKGDQEESPSIDIPSELDLVEVEDEILSATDKPSEDTVKPAGNDTVTNSSQDAIATASFNDDVVRAVRSNRYYDLRDFALTPDVVEAVYSPSPVMSPIGDMDQTRERRFDEDTVLREALNDVHGPQVDRTIASHETGVEVNEDELHNEIPTNAGDEVELKIEERSLALSADQPQVIEREPESYAEVDEVEVSHVILQEFNDEDGRPDDGRSSALDNTATSTDGSITRDTEHLEAVVGRADRRSTRSLTDYDDDVIKAIERASDDYYGLGRTSERFRFEPDGEGVLLIEVLAEELGETPLVIERAQGAQGKADVGDSIDEDTLRSIEEKSNEYYGIKPDSESKNQIDNSQDAVEIPANLNEQDNLLEQRSNDYYPLDDVHAPEVTTKYDDVIKNDLQDDVIKGVEARSDEYYKESISEKQDWNRDFDEATIRAVEERSNEYYGQDSFDLLRSGVKDDHMKPSKNQKDNVIEDNRDMVVDVEPSEVNIPLNYDVERRIDIHYRNDVVTMPSDDVITIPKNGLDLDDLTLQSIEERSNRYYGIPAGQSIDKTDDEVDKINNSNNIDRIHHHEGPLLVEAKDVVKEIGRGDSEEGVRLVESSDELRLLHRQTSEATSLLGADVEIRIYSNSDRLNRLGADASMSRQSTLETQNSVATEDELDRSSLVRMKLENNLIRATTSHGDRENEEVRLEDVDRFWYYRYNKSPRSIQASQLARRKEVEDEAKRMDEEINRKFAEVEGKFLARRESPEGSLEVNNKRVDSRASSRSFVVEKLSSSDEEEPGIPLATSTQFFHLRSSSSSASTSSSASYNSLADHRPGKVRVEPARLTPVEDHYPRREAESARIREESARYVPQYENNLERAYPYIRHSSYYSRFYSSTTTHHNLSMEKQAAPRNDYVFSRSLLRSSSSRDGLGVTKPSSASSDYLHKIVLDTDSGRKSVSFKQRIDEMITTPPVKHRRHRIVEDHRTIKIRSILKREQASNLLKMANDNSLRELEALIDERDRVRTNLQATPVDVPHLSPMTAQAQIRYRNHLVYQYDMLSVIIDEKATLLRETMREDDMPSWLSGKYDAASLTLVNQPRSSRKLLRRQSSFIYGETKKVSRCADLLIANDCAQKLAILRNQLERHDSEQSLEGDNAGDLLSRITQRLNTSPIRSD